jgi:hypothetical protein
MGNSRREMRKRKILEVTGCLLYVIAFIVMAAVFLVRWGKGG